MTNDTVTGVALFLGVVNLVFFTALLLAEVGERHRRKGFDQ